MGQKSSAILMRLGIIRDWDSKWFAKRRHYAQLLLQDIVIRKLIFAQCKHASVSRVVIERPHKRCVVFIHSAKPGILVGKKGGDIEKLKKAVEKIADCEVHINIVEVKKPDLDAPIVANGIAQQLEKRISFRRAMKKAMQGAMRAGALGIRVNCSGRLGGAEIARMEWYREGRVPLHTLRADIDYAIATAFTPYGTCGVKVWIYRGETRQKKPSASEDTTISGTPQPRPMAG